MWHHTWMLPYVGSDGVQKFSKCAYVIYEWSHSHKLLLDAASVPTYNDKICHLDVLGPNHLLQIWNLGLKIRRWRRNNPMCTPTNPKREQPLTYHKKQKIKSNQTISLVQPIYSSTYISWINFCIIFMYINTFIFLYNYRGVFRIWNCGC